VTTLPLTGERTGPGVPRENYWFRRHEAAYRWVVRHLDVAGRVLVDAGVGEGYGGQALAEAGAAVVLGLDLDQPTVLHVARTYPGVAPVRANLVSLPCADASVDVVVSSQVVEHLWDQEAFVAECARVLRPGGRAVLTTPNRLTFPPGNPFHSRELDAAELAALLATRLDVAAVHGVHHGPRLAGLDAALGGLVGRQLATDPGEWARALRRAVASVAADDFTVGEAAGSLDLVAVGVRG
jgi:SAM-dependent methyltransferase